MAKVKNIVKSKDEITSISDEPIRAKNFTDRLFKSIDIIRTSCKGDEKIKYARKKWFAKFDSEFKLLASRQDEINKIESKEEQEKAQTQFLEVEIELDKLDYICIAAVVDELAEIHLAALSPFLKNEPNH